MKQVYLQYWEESERGWGVRPDGCSIHISKDECMKYVKSIYSNRTKEVPNEYDRIIDGIVDVILKDSLYDLLLEEKSIRLSQCSMSNLLKLEEIIII